MGKVSEKEATFDKKKKSYLCVYSHTALLKGMVKHLIKEQMRMKEKSWRFDSIS